MAFTVKPKNSWSSGQLFTTLKFGVKQCFCDVQRQFFKISTLVAILLVLTLQIQFKKPLKTYCNF